jgi:hypothetical protein
MNSRISRRCFPLLLSLSSLLLCLAAGCNTQTTMIDDDEARRRDLATSDPRPDLAAPLVDMAVPRDLTPVPDLSGKPDLSPCMSDSECQSGACQPVGTDGASICVRGCKGQPDCAGLPGGLFCAPKKAGSSDGFCVPPSGKHCASCRSDSDCGSLSEACIQAPSDIAPACHIDCSLSAAACPSDYECLDVPSAPTGADMGASSRKLCLPKAKLCLDSLGGFCDRVSLPQTCWRENDAGACTGQRTCLPGGRYDRCGATTPQYKRCGDMDPPGCMLKLAADAATSKLHCGRCGNACGASEDCCSGTCKPLDTGSDCGACGRSCGGGTGCCSGSCTALNTVSNCGRCGNACPGLGSSSSDVFCDGGSLSCNMTCRGDNYDIDGAMSNGCEILDQIPPGHTQPTAASRGSKDCYDGASQDNFSSIVPSDKRVHINPPVASFSGTVGAAPDWWVVRADGGTFCVNDYLVSFSTRGGIGSPCYRLSIFTNKKSDSLTLPGNSFGSMSSGASSYSGGSDIYFLIEKVCSTPGPENVGYTVDYHL